LVVEITFIYIPLLFHSVMGFYVASIAKTNTHRYRYPRNALYTLQRLSGAVVFVFLVYHLGTTVGPKLWEGKHHFEAAPFLIDIMNGEFKTWQGILIYAIGIVSATFTLAMVYGGFAFPGAF